MICGECGIDAYSHSTSIRQSAEADVPIINDVFASDEKLGMSGNVLNNVFDLGATATLFTIGYFNTPKYSNIRSIEDSTRPTILKNRLFVNGRQLCRIDEEKIHPLSKTVAYDYLSLLNDNLPDFDAVILQDYGKGIWTEEVIRPFLRRCKALKKKVFVDPHSERPHDYYAGSFLIKANLKEAVKLFNDSNEVALKSGAEHVVVTCGKAGMYSVSKKNPEPCIAKSKYPVKCIDPTGAGDTALSVIALMMMTGHTLKQAMDLANKAASKVVQTIGVSTVSYKDL